MKNRSGRRNDEENGSRRRLVEALAVLHLVQAQLSGLVVVFDNSQEVLQALNVVVRVEVVTQVPYGPLVRTVAEEALRRAGLFRDLVTKGLKIKVNIRQVQKDSQGTYSATNPSIWMMFFAMVTRQWPSSMARNLWSE